MSNKLVGGLWAAVGTPRLDDGQLDEPALARHLEFLMNRGLTGFVMNGATGEFPLTTKDEFERITTITAETVKGRASFACALGAAGLQDCLNLGRLAAHAGAKFVLIPAPYFFPYDQDDIEAYCREAAAQLPLPALLYNLPLFTTPLEVPTAVRLIRECANIAGIKDSSGSLDILRTLSREKIEGCRIAGSDAVVVSGIREGVLDGVISGIAGVLPELLRDVWAGNAEAGRGLGEVIAQISPLPVPWGLKWIGEARGIVKASFSQPLSPRRRQQGEALKAWYQGWEFRRP